MTAAKTSVRASAAQAFSKAYDTAKVVAFLVGAWHIIMWILPYVNRATGAAITTGQAVGDVVR